MADVIACISKSLYNQALMIDWLIIESSRLKLGVSRMGLRTSVRAVLRAVFAMFFLTVSFFSTASANWFAGFGDSNDSNISTTKANKTPKVSRNVTWKVSKDVRNDLSTFRKGRSIAYLDTSVDKTPDTSRTNSTNAVFIPMDKPVKAKARNAFKMGSDGRVDYTVSIDDEENAGVDFQHRLTKEAYAKGFKAGLIKGRNNNRANGTTSDNAWANLEEKNASFILREPKKKDEYAPVNFDPTSPRDSINANAIYPSDIN